MTATTLPPVAAPAISAPWWSRIWAGLIVLVALIIAVIVIFRIPAVARWWVTTITGQDAEAQGRYGAWSGFWGALQPTLILTGLALYWRTSCHHTGCWLPGKHPTADGSTKLCRFHHPDIRGRKLTAEVIQELHELGHWRMHNKPGTAAAAGVRGP